MSDIEDKVRKIVTEHLGVEPEHVKPEASFYDDLGADSLDTIELAMAFEEEFGVEITDDECEKVTTFGDAVAMVTRAVEAAAKHRTRND